MGSAEDWQARDATMQRLVALRKRRRHADNSDAAELSAEIERLEAACE